MTEFATIGAGCFWGVQYHLEKLNGVTATEVGYCGGNTTDPSYKEVKKGDTGFAEVVKVEFDPALVSYETILEYFWRLHDPTQLNKQGPDVGTQYRSVIFYHDEKQKIAAEQSKAKFDASGVFGVAAVTEIAPYKNYFRAEDYHQNYFNINGGPVCHVLRDK